MKTGKIITLAATHIIAAVVGFAAGIYALPIITAPPAPSEAEISQASASTIYTGEFRRDLKDSDALHWGEGTVSIGSETIALMGRLSPGPDYKLYLSPEFVETEDEFKSRKETMLRIGDVKTFENFIVSVPEDVDVSQFNAVIVWCESFSQFITAAKYQ